MQIPKHVKVGGTLYKVIIAEEWEGGGGTHYDGELVHSETLGNVIYIAKHLSDDAKQITLIHEILHGCNTTMNHEFLDSLAEQLYQVIKDNKLFMKGKKVAAKKVVAKKVVKVLSKKVVAKATAISKTGKTAKKSY